MEGARRVDRIEALDLPGAVRAALATWARAAWPREACGLLVGRGARVLRAVRARNLESERAGERFELDPADHLAAELEARAAGLAVLGYWHTHPDRPARPSAADRAGSRPGELHLIQAVTRAGAGELRAWLRGETDFAELPVVSRGRP